MKNIYIFSRKMEQNKKRRMNNVSDVSDEKFVDELEQMPYLYRSIQAINFMNKNPFVIENFCNLFNEIEQYLLFIIHKFFSGVGFFYNRRNRECFKISNNISEEYGNICYFDMIVYSNLSHSVMNMNFSNFIYYLERKISDAFILIGRTLVEVNISFEGGIMFSLRLYEKNEYYNLLKGRDDDIKPNEVPEELNLI